jgi:hypothetical protein
VFPGDVDPDRPISNNTIQFALYRMGCGGRMTGHGFRGVASTVLHEQVWPHEHIELQLAHQECDGTSAAYNHALYLKPRAPMMQAWADRLNKLRKQGEQQQPTIKNQAESATAHAPAGQESRIRVWSVRYFRSRTGPRRAPGMTCAGTR